MDFSERRPEEVMFLLTLSVLFSTHKNNNYCAITINVLQIA